VNTDPSALQSVGQSVLNTYNTDCAGEGVGSLTLGSATGTKSSSPSSTGSTGSSSSGFKKTGAAGKVGMSTVGVVGAGVVGSIAALL